jgi:hypothetical protein
VQPYPPRAPGRPRNVVATAGFVWALVGAVLSLVPIIGVIAWVASPVGLVLSVVALGLATRREGAGRGLAIAGTVLGVVGLVLCVVWASVVVAAFDHLTPPSTSTPYTPPPPPADLDRTAPEVTLEVTGSASASVTRTTPDGSRTSTSEALPFRVTLPTPPTAIVSVIASHVGAPDQGPLTCTISQGGRVLMTRTETGPYPVAVCTAW